MTAHVNKPRFGKPKTVKLASLSSKLAPLSNRVARPPQTPKRPHLKIGSPSRKK